MFTAQIVSFGAGDAAAVTLASVSLIGLSIVLARWLGLRIERDLIVASARAAIQLLAVGVLFATIFRSAAAMTLAWTWVAVMVVIAGRVTGRRARYPIPGLVWVSAATITLSAGIALLVTFGFDLIGFEPVSLVVVAGITIGNAVPTAVLAVNQSVSLSRDRWGEIEALLSLGASPRDVVRFMGPRVAKTALIPQVERTKVVGLIALPGALTGLLLAGVDPIDAVIVQLLVMYLVLGTAAVCVVVLSGRILRLSVTPDLRLAEWVRAAADEHRP